MEAREDVEHLLRVDYLPEGVRPLYDTETGHRVRAKEVRLQPPWNTRSLVVEELRYEVVASVLAAKQRQKGLRPFTLMLANEVMANRDLRLDAFLVHPDFTPLMAKALAKPWCGILPKLYAHYDVPPGEVFGFAEPTYVGVVPVCNGAPGILLHNRDALIWGTFSRRAGV